MEICLYLCVVCLFRQQGRKKERRTKNHLKQFLPNEIIRKNICMNSHFDETASKLCYRFISREREKELKPSKKYSPSF